ncbi:hypothetical protein AB3R30_00665 [Leptolyngbyaceae cyanobacterium UHCC 1019]
MIFDAWKVDITQIVEDNKMLGSLNQPWCDRMRAIANVAPAFTD